MLRNGEGNFWAPKGPLQLTGHILLAPALRGRTLLDVFSPSISSSEALTRSSQSTK